VCTHIDIEIVNHHRQKYQHQYAKEKQPNSVIDDAGEPMVDVTREPRIQIVIVEDLATGINIC
jgi:hypothetical protein